MHVRADGTITGCSGRFLSGRCQPLLTQIIYRFVEITAAFRQSFLAVHHTSARFFTKIFYRSGTHFH
jgi:hypothetical protein